jgi:hypothetical protein
MRRGEGQGAKGDESADRAPELATPSLAPRPSPLAPRSWPLRRHRFALALIVLLATTLFLPALVKREVFTLRDHFDYFQPLRWFTAQELRAGNLPLWNPWSASGEPWFANPQTGVFYPPAWLFLALPFETAYMLFLLLHLVLLGAGAYLLFARKASQGAALLGAVAVMFSGPVLSLMDVQNNLATLAWIPLVLWCALEGAWRRGAIVLALAFLGGEPFFAALAALLYAIVRRKLDVVWTALAAFGITAVQLLPFLEYVSVSDRAGGAFADTLILRNSMPLAAWLHVILPLGWTGAQQFIPVLYAGVLVVALATAGMRKNTLGWIALLLFAIVIAAGPAFLMQLPLTLFRYPARLVPIAVIAIAALAVAGWERIRPALRAKGRWLDLLLVLVVVADLLPRARPLLHTAPFRTDVVPWSKEIGTYGKVLRFGEVDITQRGAWMSGYLNLYDRRFDAYTAAPLASATYMDMHRELLSKPSFEAFASAGIVHIITTVSLPQPWYPVEQQGSVVAFRNEVALPMAAHFAPGSTSVRRAEWKLDTSSATIEVNAPSDGIVVLRQQASRGWKVEVDGVPVQPLVVQGGFRGVSVKKGRHTIVWKYDPRSFRIGSVMTIVTLLALQLSVFVKRSR